MDSDCIYLIVFDFSDLKLHQMEYWLKIIKQTALTRGGSILALVIGTHADKVTEEEANNIIETLQAKFPKHTFPFLSDILAVSCKSSSGISTAKRRLRELAKSTTFPNEVPASWLQLYWRVKASKQTGNLFVSYEEYAEWAKMLVPRWGR